MISPAALINLEPSPGRALVYCFVAILCFFSDINLVAQSAERRDLEAAFIRHFGIYSKWPADTFENPQSSIGVCFVGNDRRRVGETLKGAAKDPLFTIGERKIKVQMLGQVDSSMLDALETEIDACQILFITNVKNRDWLNVRDVILNVPILTIGDMKGFTKNGGMIEISIRSSRSSYKFKINLRNVRKQVLDLDSALLSLDVVEVVDS